jgi:hypothetical protein
MPDCYYYECNEKKCSAKYPYVNPSTTNMRDHYTTVHCHIVLDPKKCKMQDMVDSFQMSESHGLQWVRGWSVDQF